MLLEVSIECFDEELLVLADFILVKNSAAFSPQENHISVSRLSHVLLLLMVDGK